MPHTTVLPFLHMYFALSNVCFPQGHLGCWAQPYSMMGLLGLVGFSCVMGLPWPLLTEAPAATLLLMLIQSWQYTFNLFLSIINSSGNYQYMNGFMRYQPICPKRFIYLFIYFWSCYGMCEPSVYWIFVSDFLYPASLSHWMIFRAPLFQKEEERNGCSQQGWQIWEILRNEMW